MTVTPRVDWPSIRAVIFDVDGTMYRQRPLRLVMASLLGWHYGPRPWCWKELRALAAYRALRKKLAGEGGYNLESLLHKLTSQRTGLDEERVARCVQTWILERPLPHLAQFRVHGLVEFCLALADRGLRLGVYSDYPAKEKIRALGLPDMESISSHDIEAGRLKPDPTGLLVLTRRFGLGVDECLFIGDREELDGECARRAGMRCLIRTNSPKRFHEFFDFHELQREIEADP